MTPKDLAWDQISADAFGDLLQQYPALIKAISASKANPGRKTLEDLDHFRYQQAPQLFSSSKPQRLMNHDDVKVLVDWKLRHGKFRPTLMKFVSSNDSSFVDNTIADATRAYDKNEDTSQALGTLCKLKGIGPATASLLLAVHYPDDVPFFSDESFYWLCNDGKKESLKYTTKEYELLVERSRALRDRLSVSALDIERVSYVLMKQDSPSLLGSDPAVPAKATSKQAVAQKTSSKKMSESASPGTQAPSPQESDASATKRKTPSMSAAEKKVDEGNLRRSKRNKSSLA